MSRLRLLLGDERGFSLVFTLLTILVTSVTVTSAIQYTTSNASSANRSKADQIAYALAEAGLANGAAVLSKPSNNALSQSTLPSSEPTTDSNYILQYPGGTVKFWGVLTGHQWVMHGLGIVTDPTGRTTPVRRHATSTIRIMPTLKQALNSNAWNYMFAKGTTASDGCDVKLENSVAVDASMYILGGLCLYNTSSIVKAAAPDVTGLVVGEHIWLSNPSTTIGTSTAKIASAQIAGGCRYGGVNPGTPGETWTNPCTSTQKVFADVISSDPVVGTGPTADFAYWYANAKPGPSQPCASGTTPTFEAMGSTTMSPSAGPYSVGPFNLTPNSSYTCQYWDNLLSPAELLGELSWNHTTKVLTVKGVVFIDGSVYVSNNSTNRYVGLGTLYAAGTFTIDGTSQLCGGIASGNCDFASWDPNSAMLGIITNGVDAGYGFKLQNSARFQGSIYATGNVLAENFTQFDGPMVANSFSLENSVQTHEFPTINSVPVGWPGNPTVYAEPQPPQNYSG
ncbi:MAG TPA: hypothetical protein VFV62_06570 [Gaiellaceae bacterium]|nr:hypothetical protein [Gaiellaceae bacterium]